MFLSRFHPEIEKNKMQSRKSCLVLLFSPSNHVNFTFALRGATNPEIPMSKEANGEYLTIDALRPRKSYDVQWMTSC
jgi:hypothetical protein